MLSHQRFIRHNIIYLGRDPKTADDEYVSVLPLPWIVEQCYCLGFNLLSRMKVNFPESPETTMTDMREVGPTFVLMAPRVLEQIAADMRARVMDAGVLTQWIFNSCLKRGLQAVEDGKRHWLADLILFSALRDRLGLSRVRSAATGGAAMGPDTFKFFLAMGLPLRQLYGQTELIGAYTLQEPNTNEVDSVGVPFDGCQVRIENPDQNGVGEIVSQHDNMFLGYYKNDAATKADLRNGWMYTGDAGYFDAQQRLIVIDRMKDIAVMSNQAKFSPQFIENKLKFSPYIAEAVILGAARPYLTAIVCVRFSTVSKWAEKNRIPFTSYTNLSAQDEIYDLVRQQIEDVNAHLPASQKIRKFLLLFKELDADDGELTRTRKVRRGVVTERYGALIEALYADKDTATIDTAMTLEDGRQARLQAEMAIMTISP
jgi:long-chain acyl-CoA synthetase